ncbi:MAG: hypothetical protein AABY15_08710 [Nanoarchaeota archaeon]
MPKKIKDPTDSNVELEVYDEEEFNLELQKKVDAEKVKIQEEMSNLQKDWESKETEYKDQIVQKEEEYQRLTKELEGLDDKDKNFAKVREQLQAKDREISELKTDFTKQLNDMRDSISKKEDDAIFSAMAGGEQELRDKIEHHYSKLKVSGDTPENKQEKLRASYFMATGKDMPDPLKMSMGAGVASSTRSETEQSIPQTVKDLGKSKFGLTDEDFQKHGQPKSDNQ